jgi:EAL domain-containing protein (putative c-di-GMP-specific phosphodiesterase class I)
VCFQVTEELAAAHRTEVQALAVALKRRGLRFALERFGSGRDPVALLQSIPLDFVKIDGALVQGLAANTALQSRITQLVDGARTRKILTIAERVEDANTMAVLFQLGVQFVQGYFINEPEQVVLES